MERVILHCDCNSFFASVECAYNPALKDVPVAVCGNPENRHGIILAKNEIAKKYGVNTAETIWQAKKKCPKLVLVPPHYNRYQEYSYAVNKIYEQYTDQIEPFGIDESWLDVTGSTKLFGSGEEIANKIREQVKNELGITISVGVSFNKIFAKLGSDYKKPDAVTVISKENYKQIVYPLPITDLLFVGRSCANILNKMYIFNIGELANTNREVLIGKLGKAGGMLYDYANGLDDSKVNSFYEKTPVKSVSKGMTFKKNLQTKSEIITGLTTLAQNVASTLRDKGIKGNCIQVVIKDTNLKSISRQVSLPIPTCLAKDIIDNAMNMIEKSWDLSKPIRMLSVGVSGIIDANADELTEQYSFFCDDSNCIQTNEKQEKLESAIYNIRQKYGNSAVKPGCIINNDLGIDE